jgi:branched-chain amino acid transport system permease protein
VSPPGHSRARWIVFGLVLVALAAMPLVADKFYIQFLTKMLIMAILAMSLDLLIGYTGLVSFGHAAFYGTAGYVLGFMTPQYEAASFWLTFPAAVGASAALALAIGFFAVRTHGIYFIMVTLAFAQMLYVVFHDTKIGGGNDGMYIDVRPALKIGQWQPLLLDNFVHMYFVALACAAAAYLVLRAIVAAPFGRVLVGIRANEHRMRSLGFPTFRYKLVAFTLAGALGGVAGYLSAAQFGVVNPEFLGWHLSGAVMMMVILGGMGTLVGPALGAAAWMLLEELFRDLPQVGAVNLGKHWQLWMGSFIVLAAIFLPAGLIGFGQKLWAKRFSKRGV